MADDRGGGAGVFILDGDDPNSMESPLGDCFGETGSGEMARAASDWLSMGTGGDEGRRSSGRIGAGMDGGGGAGDDDDELNQLRKSGSFLTGGGASEAAVVDPLA